MDKIQTFKKNGKAGVIYVMEKASKKGFYYGNKKWANLGQGAPELGMIQNCPPRISEVKIPQINHGYAPVAGVKELRKSVANIYNNLFRKDLDSKLSLENVSIAGGGRVALSRIFASMEQINVGYFLPDYASYEGILSVFNNINPIAYELESKNHFKINLDRLKEFIEENKIKALLLSNPTNPTGNLLYGDSLKKLVEIAKEMEFTLILDEFYFNYIFIDSENYVSAQKYIKDVNSDPVVIIAGLTKPWRYPGWRICWAIAPKDIQDLITSTGSFLDGGANHPLQNAALNLLKLDQLRKESKAIKTHFRNKRDYMIKRLKAMNIKIDNKPEGAFYIWANLKDLPKPLNDGMKFFQKGLEENFIVVPGIFFDLNPHSKRKNRKYQNYVRISYSSELKTIKKGLDSINRLIDKYSK
ncbi:aminotransferase class I/II-fold pyridoxal phosphate-dependent enzyme [Candidatus Dojkabacteria bacterium]|nr:aminotransferase class I/II-fold pyridoxal phosphate-dependent enzyme [Candidatus Dojkabacteria bacterium]